MNILLDGNEYATSGKLNVFEQLNLARKLGSALAVIEGMTDSENASKDKTLLSVLMLSNISDADSDFVVKKCLSVVTRKQNAGYAKIQTSEGHMMFNDISLAVMLELTVSVIEENLGDFFRTALGGLRAETAGSQSL